MLLTFVGSKPGEEYPTPVGYWVKDGHLIVTTQSPWWRNLRGGQPVSMQVRGQHREGIATPHPDPEDLHSTSRRSLTVMELMLPDGWVYGFTVIESRLSTNRKPV